MLLGLGACNPIETYRNLTGASKNDPNPATTPNTKNLAAGEQSPYPNLATVPPPPTREMTMAEVDKLTQSLIADRRNAKYTTEQLQAGFNVGAGPAPPPPPAAPATAPKPTPAPAVAAPAAAPGQAASTTPAATKVTNATPAATGPRKPGEPPAPGPMESSLQTPQIPSLPQPQQNEPAPPPPLLHAPAAASAPHRPGPPAPAPMPAALASAQFEPPPPPVLPPASAGQTASRAASVAAPGKAKASASAPPVDTPVAQIDFAANSTTLSAADRQSLGSIVPLYRSHPGKVRVVGYSGVGSSADQQLNGFQAALDRAQTVADALAKAGIPADKILVEAAPTGSDSGQSRAEVLLEH
ncbi:MAG TPA: OmpA family protein [Stellaceae bacterium]|nr:OmpA family protein [Stellaceae bacterium]